MQNLHIAFWIDFSFSHCILYVSSDNGLATSEKFDHLSLCKPHGILFKLNGKGNLAIG